MHQVASDVESSAAQRASVKEPVLEGVSPELAGRRFPIPPGRQTIGRLGNNDIVLLGRSVSSSHAWITNQKGRCMIMNTLSTNGTFVNDKRIHQAALRHGDHIRLGKVELIFLTREPGSAKPFALGRLLIALIVVAAVVGMAAWAWLRP